MKMTDLPDRLEGPVPKCNNGWSKIETAPKDGTIFLGWNGEYTISYWRDNPYGNGSGWGQATDCTTVWCNGLTHWKPIKPPETE